MEGTSEPARTGVAYGRELEYGLVRAGSIGRLSMALVLSLLRVISVLQQLEERIANPIFRSILRSRVHWIVSRRLALIAYVGRHSGQRYAFPVAYHQLDGAIVVVTPKGATNWWRNFRDPRECRVWLRGMDYPATGELVPEKHQEALLAEYGETHGLLGRIFGSDLVHESADRLAVVRFAIESP